MAGGDEQLIYSGDDEEWPSMGTDDRTVDGSIRGFLLVDIQWFGSEWWRN